MIFTIYVFDIVWDVDKEDCICVGADGEDYYETPELPTEHSFTIERDELGYCSNAYREERNDLIGNVLTKKEGFFVKTFDYSIRAVVEDSLPMEYYEEEEEERVLPYEVIVSDVVWENAECGTPLPFHKPNEIYKFDIDDDERNDGDVLLRRLIGYKLFDKEVKLASSFNFKIEKKEEEIEEGVPPQRA